MLFLLTILWYNLFYKAKGGYEYAENAAIRDQRQMGAARYRLVFALIWLFNAYKLGRLRIHLTYKTQLIVSVVIILLANILTTILKHWIYRSIGFVLCGLLWIINPAMIKGGTLSKKYALCIRLAGVVLILIGVFTRAYFY